MAASSVAASTRGCIDTYGGCVRRWLHRHVRAAHSGIPSTSIEEIPITPIPARNPRSRKLNSFSKLRVSNQIQTQHLPSSVLESNPPPPPATPAKIPSASSFISVFPVPILHHPIHQNEHAATFLHRHLLLGHGLRDRVRPLAHVVRRPAQIVGLALSIAERTTGPGVVADGLVIRPRHQRFEDVDEEIGVQREEKRGGREEHVRS